VIGNTCKQFPTVPSKYESRMASSLFRISIVAGFPPADEYVVADGRDASCMMLNVKLASALASCPYRQFHNEVVSEFIVSSRIHRKLVDDNVYFPSVCYGPKPCPISLQFP
jgi:hypothetical protein